MCFLSLSSSIELRECLNFIVRLCSNVCVVENDIVFLCGCCYSTRLYTCSLFKCVWTLLLVFCFNVSHLKYRCILSVRRIAIIIIDSNVIFFSFNCFYVLNTLVCAFWALVLCSSHFIGFFFSSLSLLPLSHSVRFCLLNQCEAIADMRLQPFFLLRFTKLYV